MFRAWLLELKLVTSKSTLARLARCVFFSFLSIRLKLIDHVSSIPDTQVVKASVMYDPHTRDSRGFGFVMMDNPEDAAACIAEYDKKDFMGKVMTVAMVRPEIEKGRLEGLSLISWLVNIG